MLRLTVRHVLPCLFVLACLAVWVLRPHAAEEAQKENKVGRVPSIASVLSQPIKLEKTFAAKTSLSEALDVLSERTGLPIYIDRHAFHAAIGAEDVGKMPVKLPRVLGARLASVLRLLLKEISAPGGGEAPGWQAVY